MLCETPLQNSVAYRHLFPRSRVCRASTASILLQAGLVGFTSVHMYFGGQSKWAATSCSSHGISLKQKVTVQYKHLKNKFVQKPFCLHSLFIPKLAWFLNQNKMFKKVKSVYGAVNSPILAHSYENL